MSEILQSFYGEYPPHWNFLTLEEISERITDGSHFSPKPVAFGKMMCSVKDMTYNKFDFSQVKFISEEDFYYLKRNGCKPERGDLLISKDGANCLDLLFINKHEEEFVILSSIALIRLKKDITPDFVRYFLLSPNAQFIMRNNFVSGSAIPRVVLKDFKKVAILLPPLPEQKAIAGVLLSLDDKIDLLHRQNKTLEAMTETLFRQWFIEEAEGDWEIVELSTFGKIICGKTPFKKKLEYFGNDIPFIKIPDMHQQIYILSTIDSLSFKGQHSQDNKTIPKGAICVSCIATVGLVSLTSKPSQTNQQINSIIPKMDYHRYFLYLLMKSYFDILQAMASGGTATLNLNTGDFSKIKIVQPPEKKLKKFHTMVDPIFGKILLNQNQIQLLQIQRDTLLPKLMSGEIKVEV